MNYINNNNLDQKTYHTIKKDNPNVSLPKSGTEVILDSWYLVHDTPKPDYNVNTQKIELDIPVKVDNYYSQSWNVVDLDVDQLATKLEKLKTNKLVEMKAARDEVVNGTTEITTSLGNTFVVDANIKNRSTMHQAITNAVNAGFTDADSINWKHGDNQYQATTYGEMKEIGIQLGVFINTQYQKEAVKIGEINAAILDTIDAVNWE